MTAGRKVNSLSQSWGTPPKYVNAIKAFWNGIIDLDPCSNEYSIVHAATEFRLPTKDGLKEDWSKFKHIYVNPPYGADRLRHTSIKDWLGKCARTYQENAAEIIALVPVAPNTSHWKQCVFGQASAICFLYDTRLRFLENGLDTGKGAPMACSLVYWGNEVSSFLDHFISFGAVIDIRNLQHKRIGTETMFPHDIFIDKNFTIKTKIQ